MLPKPLNQTVSQQEIDQGEARKRQRGTGFTNIGRILGANIGAGQRMGQSIGTQLGQQAEQVRKGIEAGQSQFKAGMQESAKKEQEKLGKAETALTGIKEMQPQTQPVNYEAIGMGLRGAEYTGPKGIENIQEQQQRAMNLAALGRLSGMAGGQQELLRSQVAGRGRYGLGQSALDAMLLGREGQRQLEAARSATGALASQAQQTQTMAQEQARAMESSIEANKLAALEKIQKEYGGIQEKGTEQAQKFVSDVNKLAKLMNPKNFTPEELDKIKQDPEVDSLLKRAEAGEFGDIKQLGQLYTKDQAAFQNTINALASKLTPPVGGRYYQGQQQEQAANLARLLSGAKAGEDIEKQEYKTKLFDPNQAGLEGILGSQKEAKETAIKNLKAQDLAPAKAAMKGEDWSSNVAKIDPRLLSAIDKKLDSMGETSHYNRRATGSEVAQLFILPELEKAISSRDYEKDPRISLYKKDPFEALRENLGLSEKKSAQIPKQKILSEEQIKKIINLINKSYGVPDSGPIDTT